MSDELTPPLFEAIFPVDAANVETENIKQHIVRTTNKMNLRKETTSLLLHRMFLF